MPAKFECPKCGRRFTEWGAEKNGFRCPGDEWSSHAEEIELVRGGTPDSPTAKKPSLKRHKIRPTAVAKPKPVLDEDEALVGDAAELGDDEDDDVVSDDNKSNGKDDMVPDTATDGDAVLGNGNGEDAADADDKGDGRD
ncbi:MAG: hypothetical protein GY851_33510 [bacterium]|nr:hypothetical protein [bacterium]